MRLDKLQRRALNRIIRRYRAINAHNGVTSIRLERKPIGDSNLTSVTLRTHRSDCHKHSPRAALTEEYGHFIIDPRGRIKVCYASSGTRPCTAHVKRMLSRYWPYSEPTAQLANH